jgi:3-hydroxymyristoyl/3-hydroxydecanoyl-(acyl carrier protein) dehydratase
MSMRLTGTDRGRLRAFWDRRGEPAGSREPAPAPLFDRRHVLAFAAGRPSEAFGDPYRPFDSGRFIARLPAPPYSFIDRVVEVEPPPWRLEPGGWLATEFDVSPDHWYFRAHRADTMPLCVLMEVALQNCGFLAAYMGSALKSPRDLRFRNLDGTATVHRNVYRRPSTLRSRARLTRASSAGDMIIETFDFEVTEGGIPVYSGQTSFGFFTAEALDRQVGLPGPEDVAVEGAGAPDTRFALPDLPPLSPSDDAGAEDRSPGMPGRAIRMIDVVDPFLPAGGPKGLGALRGLKTVRPDEWFFRAHFHQDPVCPGSLGIESLVQLARFAVLDRWREDCPDHRLELATGTAHTWRYRGQILPRNREVEVTAAVTRPAGGAEPGILVDGALKVDGLLIYKMRDFGIRLAPPTGSGTGNRPGGCGSTRIRSKGKAQADGKSAATSVGCEHFPEACDPSPSF